MNQDMLKYLTKEERDICDMVGAFDDDGDSNVRVFAESLAQARAEVEGWEKVARRVMFLAFVRQVLKVAGVVKNGAPALSVEHCAFFGDLMPLGNKDEMNNFFMDAVELARNEIDAARATADEGAKP